MASAAFLALTIHSFGKIPELSDQASMNPMVIEGKHLWDKSNCMGCHTLLGEGGYYAPELTKVYERRGPGFIRAVIEDPQGMYPGQRKMYEYDFTDHEIDSLIAFFEWIGGMDLNGFPPEPVLFAVATPSNDGNDVATRTNRPQVYNQMCVACHSLGGQGGSVGPALDDIGDRMTKDELVVWLENPNAVRPGTTMPKLPLSDAARSELAAYLAALSGGPGPAGDSPEDVPDSVPEVADAPPQNAPGTAEVPPQSEDANTEPTDSETQQQQQPQPSPTGTEETE